MHLEIKSGEISTFVFGYIIFFGYGSGVGLTHLRKTIFGPNFAPGFWYFFAQNGDLKNAFGYGEKSL